jgi:hypothetical protein
VVLEQVLPELVHQTITKAERLAALGEWELEYQTNHWSLVCSLVLSEEHSLVLVLLGAAGTDSMSTSKPSGEEKMA